MAGINCVFLLGRLTRDPQSAALKETARLTAAVEGVARELDHLTTELREGELRDTNRLLATLLGQLGCPYERR